MIDSSRGENIVIEEIRRFSLNYKVVGIYSNNIKNILIVLSKGRVQFEVHHDMILVPQSC